MARRGPLLAIAAALIVAMAASGWWLLRPPTPSLAPVYVVEAPPARLLAAAEIADLAEVQATWASAHRQGWALCARSFLDGQELSAPVRFFGAAPPASAGFTAGYERCRADLLELIAKHGEDRVRAALGRQAEHLDDGALQVPKKR
ncbi:MAG: hypothetical protein H0W72_17565 [Planctomycetes bacterium]|nr:hypothetical protein [Planctomycetota bacterium]